MLDHCNFSTGIYGEITAGRGKLDNHGYWEFPCEECTNRANYRMEKQKAAEDRQARLVAALKPFAMQHHSLDGKWCHSGLIPVEECAHCKPILEARKLIAEIERFKHF